MISEKQVDVLERLADLVREVISSSGHDQFRCAAVVIHVGDGLPDIIPVVITPVESKK